MTILPLHPSEHASPEALGAFLRDCRAAARRDRHAKLISISLAVDALDPLAVLESIFEPQEPHFYTERPAIATAIAGAEVAAEQEASGRDRFASVQRWIDETLAHTIAVGDVGVPFGGPHFFCGFTFFDEVEKSEPFPAAYAFVPRWQVALAGDTTTAVANFMVDANADLAALGARILRAHGKFSRFEYRAHSDGIASGRHRDDGAGAPVFDPREPSDYPAAVRKALALIAGGQLRKIVLARARDVAAPEPLHPLQMLNGLRQRFPDCYSFSFTRGRGPSFIGASPERLVRVSRGRLETEALAGSVGRGAGASEDAALSSALRHSDKERREHRAVLDDILARLAPLGLVPEYPAQPQVRRLANVQHLHTPVHAAVPDGVRPLEAVAALHPTPAVGGSPRDAAVARIRDLEGFSRGLYAGALGWLNARGGGEFFVGLRSALIEGTRARTYAGAGIVEGSVPEEEYAETELKFQAMLDALGAEQR